MTEQDKKKLQLIISEIDALKCKDIALMDLVGIYPLTDYVIIATCESSRQMQAVAENIVHRLKKNGYKIHHREGNGDDVWFLLDYNDVIVNLFLPDSRDYYDLEELYKNARSVSLGEVRKENGGTEKVEK